MNMITYYMPDGKVVKIEKLSKDTVKNCHGMKIKCTLLDGTHKVGFANPFYSFKKGGIVTGEEAKQLEYITVETFKYLNEETHQLSSGDGDDKYDVNREMILINLIVRIDAILYSAPRWDGSLTNKFTIKE